MTAGLRQQGYAGNPKRVARLMRQMGLHAISPKPRLRQPVAGHLIYPYLLRGVTVERVKPVWSADLTSIRLQAGFVSLVAVIAWFSRYVLSWAVSISMDGLCCLAAREQAWSRGRPEVFNTDPGAQFTSPEWTARLQQGGGGSGWMAAVEPWTTCAASACGGV